MRLNTKWFFFMLAAHMCSGRPVVADCIVQNSCGDCVPFPSGKLPERYRSAAFLHDSTRVEAA